LIGATVSTVTAPTKVTADLNAEQRRAVEFVRGPVVILAGAGTGKTTTITRRIANQVLTKGFSPAEILAVTFTRRAAEMKTRLAALGVSGVPTSTFHSAAQRQITHFANERRQVVSNKLALLYPLLNALPREHRNVAATDLATEIERARNGRITPENYPSQLAGSEPPLPAELMAKVFGGYEKAKRDAKLIDHEDQLELAVRIFETDDAATETFRARYRAFTVDEFQDVNLLQWTLLLPLNSRGGVVRKPAHSASRRPQEDPSGDQYGWASANGPHLPGLRAGGISGRRPVSRTAAGRHAAH
jgi:DNA helicase II / ATP-dependent DNA helicase PcrA